MQEKKWSVDLDQKNFKLPESNIDLEVDREKDTVKLFSNGGFLCSLTLNDVFALMGICQPTRVFNSCDVKELEAGSGYVVDEGGQPRTKPGLFSTDPLDADVSVFSEEENIPE